MKLNLYTVFDSQAQRAVVPFVRDNDDVAKRDFISIINNPETPFGKHPEDYFLYYVGEWNDESMNASSFGEPTRIMTGVDALKKQKQDLDAIASLQAQIDKIKTNGIAPQAE